MFMIVLLILQDQKVYEWIISFTMNDNTVPNFVNSGQMFRKFKWWAQGHICTYRDMGEKRQNNSY